MPRKPGRELLTVHRTGSFELDSVGGPWPGYTLNEGWNGWATPRFTREVADQITAHFRATFGCDFAFDEATGKYLLKPCSHKDLSAAPDAKYTDCEMNTYDEPEVFGFEDATIDGATVRLYWIGTMGWTWEDAA